MTTRKGYVVRWQFAGTKPENVWLGHGTVRTTKVPLSKAVVFRTAAEAEQAVREEAQAEARIPGSLFVCSAIYSIGAAESEERERRVA